LKISLLLLSQWCRLSGNQHQTEHLSKSRNFQLEVSIALPLLLNKLDSLPNSKFLGMFAKLRKAIISFVMSVRSTIIPLETTQFPPDGFSWNLTHHDFSKIFKFH
jgi:hypothetical protein